MQYELVGFGAHCIKPPRFVLWEDQERRTREMLSHALNLRDLIVFAGAGCSAPLGFPSWDQLATFAIVITQERLAHVDPELVKETRKECMSRLDCLRKLVAQENASASNLLFILAGCETMWDSALAGCNKAWEGTTEFRSALAKILSGRDSYEQLQKWLPAEHDYNLGHDCRHSLPLEICHTKAAEVIERAEAALCKEAGEPGKTRSPNSVMELAKNPADFLLQRLVECEAKWNNPNRSREDRAKFRAKLNEILSPKNPYDELLKLQVHRFITSNYDCSLEEAIIRARKGQENDYIWGGKHFGKKSFTQDEEYDEQLAMFAIAYASEREPKVFHCHGWHHQPGSMIITENDYQRWYLKDLALAGGRYRQTIDLTFGSNPILFVGFSLRDEDLLVALRALSAIEPERKFARPVFALLEDEDDKGDRGDKSRFEQLYDRYGVHAEPGIGGACESGCIG